jgi:hypothetical protein
MYICETCGQQVRPKSYPDRIVYAARIIQVTTMGSVEERPRRFLPHPLLPDGLCRLSTQVDAG